MPIPRSLSSLQALLLAGLLAAPVAHGLDVYRWVDARGVVHYSDKPTGTATEAIEVQSSPTDPEAAERARERIAEKRASWDEADTKRAESRQAAGEDNARRAENCRRARARLNRLSGGERLYKPTEDGEREYLSAAEIDAEKDQARADVAEWCN